MGRRPILATFAAALVAALLLLPGAVVAQSPAPANTPEDAVTAYLAAVASNDVDAILEATAVDEMVAGFDFAASAERLGALNLAFSLAPTEYPMFGEMNRYQQAAQILAQVRNLTYGLLSDESVDGRVIVADVAQIAAFVAAVDPSRLAGLKVLDVRLPEPEAASDERFVETFARIAATYGADEMTERLALIELDGETWGVGFTLIRYGDTWLVSSQQSVLGNTTAFGTAEPMTRAEYDDRTS
jgi:hypothetical protein